MINKDELIKNVQRLLQGYANSSNDIKVTTRTPNEADVYIDGKLFNTYLIEEKISFEASRLTALLGMMEIKGIIRKGPDKKYEITRRGC